MPKIVSLPETDAELNALSAAEIEALIAALRKKQEESSPSAKITRVRFKSRGVWGNAFGGGFRSRIKKREIPSIAEGWARDAANIRGDFERVGRDMWIGVLQNALSEKRANAQ